MHAHSLNGDSHQGWRGYLGEFPRQLNFKGDEMVDIKFDGSATHEDFVTPFDAHEQLVNGEHVPTTVNSPDKTNVVEFPKAVDHIQKEGAPKGHMEPVIAKNAEHEKELLEAMKEKE